MWIRADAVDEERPRVADVSSFRAVSWEDRRENCDVIDYVKTAISSMCNRVFVVGQPGNIPMVLIVGVALGETARALLYEGLSRGLGTGCTAAATALRL